jgi:hypothetical protein
MSTINPDAITTDVMTGPGVAQPKQIIDDTFAAIKNQFVAAKTDVEALESDVGTLETGVSSLTSEVTTARGSEASLDVRLDESETTLNALVGGATISDIRLIEIASKRQFNSFVMTKEDSRGRTTEANITWEDGSTGIYQLMYYNQSTKMYDGWRATHNLSGRQVRQPAVTRNRRKKTTTKPAYVAEGIVLEIIRNLVTWSEAATEFAANNATWAPSAVNFVGQLRPSFILEDPGSSQGVMSLHSSVAKINGAEYIGSIAIKKQTGTTHFCTLTFNFTGGTTQVSLHAVINPRTGVVSAHQGLDAGVIDDDDCWRVWFKASDSSDNNLVRLRVFPAFNTTGTTSVSGTVTGTVEVTAWQLEQAAALTAYQKKQG